MIFNRSIAGTIFAGFSIIIFLMAVLLGYFLIKTEYVRMRQETQRIETKHIIAQQELIQNEVARVTEYIDFMRSQTETRVQNEIREQVYAAHTLAETIYRQNRGRMNVAALQETIIETLRPLRFNEGRGYFFITDLDGVEQLFADHPEMEQQNIIDMRDGQGRFVIRDMIAIVRSKGEGFYRYDWTKPGHAGNNYPKLAFIKNFEPFDWFIGTGEYLDDMEQELQLEALARISRIRFGNDGYIFVFSPDGTMLWHPDPAMIGRNLIDYTDPDGRKVIRELLKTGRNPGGGYVRYVWPKLSTGRDASKLSYATYIDKWDWVVGTGVYLDDLESAIAAEQAGYRQAVKDRIIFIIIIFGSFISVSLIIAHMVSRRMQTGVRMFTDFLKKTSLSYEKIDPALFTFSEFQIIADYTNRLVDAFKASQENLNKSREEYRRISENIPVAVYSALPDDHSTPIFISGSIAELTGYEAAEYMKNPGLWNAIVNPQDRERLWRTIEQHRRQRGLFQAEYRISTKDGNQKWIRDVATPTLDSQGKILRIDGFMEDITDRKLAEEALLESEKRYRQLVEGAGDAIYVHSFEGRIIDVNREGHERLGYSRNEILAMNIRDLHVPEDADLTTRNILAMKTKESLIFECTHRHKNGARIPIEVRSQNVEYGGRHVILSIARDISERIRTEEKRRLYEISLLRSQKMEAIGTLAGGIAHDFNNILAAIIGYTELAMMDEEDPQQRREHLDEVLKAGNRARDLVKQILTFSRREDGEIKPVMLKHIIKEALNLLRATLPATIEIRKNVKSSATVLADPTQILQIVMNLCTNAAHSMSENGGILTVTLDDLVLDEKTALELDARKPGPYVRLEVGDTGCGIAPEIMDRIFEPYFTTKTQDKGTGLGLALVHGIVAGCGGVIKVASSPGKGTVFSVYLPRIDKTAVTESSAAAITPTGTERILFVDDEAPLANLARLLLERLGYNVTVRMSSTQALDLFRNDPFRFDLVITDVTMPVMTGDKLAREILKIRPDIPIILCTGYSENISKEQAQAIGIRAYILKPIVKQEMARTVREVLDNH